MDTKTLLKALDNDSNEKLLNFTTAKILEMNTNVLKELHLTKKETNEILGKLKGYKYVDEMDDINYGTYIRWIPINNPEEIYLTKGALFCSFKITDEGVSIICKNHGSNRHFQIKMDECLVFQKLTNQELVLLSALDHLSK
jgi:hypothetical protein